MSDAKLMYGNTKNAEPVAHKRAINFFVGATILYAVAFAVQTLLPSYLGFKGSEALSFSAADSWCQPSVQGFGAHCFGDFYYSLHFANLNAPWSSDLFAYPPLSLAFFKPFVYFVGFAPASRWPLMVYLLLCMIAVVTPAAHAYISGRLKKFHAAVVVAFSLVAAPVLVGFDRGNNQLLLIPLVYFFVLGVLEKRNQSIYIWGVLLVLFKPQMVVLGAIFLVNREWKQLINWSLLSGFSFLSSFLIYPKNLLSNIRAYVDQIANYQNSASPGAIAPTNLSIANMWSWFYAHVISRSGITLTEDRFYPTLVTGIILAIVFMSLYIIGRFRTLIVNLFIVLALPILIPNTSFAYYLCILLPVFIVILADTLSPSTSGSGFLRLKNGKDSQPLTAIFRNRTNAILLSLTFYLLFIPWALPWGLLPSIHDRAWGAIGMNWILGEFAILGLFISLTFTGSIAAFTRKQAE